MDDKISQKIVMDEESVQNDVADVKFVKICEIHKPNYHNQSRQQQPPLKQTRKHELAP